jgi:hypothetical protein
MFAMDFSVFHQNRHVFLLMGIVSLICVIFNVARSKKLKTAGQNFLVEHPDSVKVYLTTKALITIEAVTVHGIDGKNPSPFIENGKSGFYTIPGKRMVEMSYTYSRPGLLHKTVTQTVGPVKKELVIDMNKSYLLGFNRQEEAFTFEEIPDSQKVR